ncbi:hypothetical protein SLE2022_329150 [Rubroshorea leprosula]
MIGMCIQVGNSRVIFGMQYAFPLSFHDPFIFQLNFSLSLSHSHSLFLSSFTQHHKKLALTNRKNTLFCISSNSQTLTILLFRFNPNPFPADVSSLYGYIFL